MNDLKGSVFITAKEIQFLRECSRRQAFYEHQAIRSALGIKSKYLTVQAYIEYLDADPKHIISFLNRYR